tara:strand:+ start:166 stop:321 length:156 start_codon:yes stop_codon:yes gene_type:complete
MTRYRIERWLLVNEEDVEISMTLTEAQRLLAHYEMLNEGNMRHEIVEVEEE